MPKLIDITGKVFGSWKAIRYLGKERWLCVCQSCGREAIRKSHRLKVQKNGICNKCFLGSLIKHGHAIVRNVSRAYNVWHSMKQRCENSRNLGYSNYGGRGIKVCLRWQKFEMFLRDMGNPPEGLSIERKNNDGDYEPSNCKWATKRQQGNNRSTNRFVILDGLRITVTEAAREIGYRPESFRAALKRRGIRPDQIPIIYRIPRVPKSKQRGFELS